MPNKRQIKISVIILLVFIITGCSHFIELKGLPTDLAGKIQEEIGDEFDFGSLVITDAKTGKSVFLKRTETIDNGKELQYETRIISRPVKVKNIKKISSYSVFGAKLVEKNSPDDPKQCSNIGHSMCNIVTINGKSTLVCKKTESLFQQASTSINSLLYNRTIPEVGDIITKIIELPKELINELEALGGEKVNEIGFLVVQDLKTGNMKLLTNEGYERVKFDSMRDCIGKLTNAKSVSSIVYEGSCCSTQSHGSDLIETCNRRC